jgi:hypothetical protein
MSKRKMTIGVVVILLVGGTVWAWMSRPDAQVEKVKQMQAEAFKEDATPEQRRQNFELVHQEMEKLSPGQRDQVREYMREGMERRMDQQVSAYFALPQEQKIAYLDKQIKEMEQRRKEGETRRAQAGQSGQRQGGAGGPPGGPGGPGGQQAGGRGQPRPPQSADARLQRRDQRLDRSTAQQRAQRSAYFADMQQRRLQLGLPASPFPGRGPGR